MGERSASEHVDAMIEEVEKLKEASSIIAALRLASYSIIVVVKKKNVKWRVCVDFTSLNRACPKAAFSC